MCVYVLHLPIKLRLLLIEYIYVNLFLNRFMLSKKKKKLRKNSLTIEAVGQVDYSFDNVWIILKVKETLVVIQMANLLVTLKGYLLTRDFDVRSLVFLSNSYS